YAENMRMVSTSILVERDCFFWCIESAAAQPVFDIDEHIGQIATAYFHRLGLVCAFARRILAHINLCWFRSSSVELHRATHGRDGAGINRRGCGRSRLFFRSVS